MKLRPEEITSILKQRIEEYSVETDLAALTKLKTGKSLSVPVGPPTPSEISCSSHPAPYEGTEISDSCRDTLTWGGTVTFVKS